MERIKEKLSVVPWYIWLLVATTLTVFIIVLALYPLSPGGENLIQKTLVKPSSTQGNIPTPPAPTPRPITHGPVQFNVSGGKKGLPHVTMVLIDPADPTQGTSQTISVHAVNDTPIKEVVVTLHTDGKDTDMPPLAFSSGTNVDGVWKGSWQFNFTYNSNYQITVVAKNGNGLGSPVTITLR